MHWIGKGIRGARIVMGAPLMAVGGILCLIAWFTMGPASSQRVLDAFVGWLPGDEVEC